MHVLRAVTYRESLRDIEARLRSRGEKLYHLRIKAFYGTSENAVKTQTRITVSTYFLVAIILRRLPLEQNLNTILQILRVTLFEKMSLDQLFANYD